MKSYLEPTQAAGRALMQRGLRGPVVMLNLLRFLAVADYSAFPDIAPAAPISGAEAYERYMVHTMPFLEKSGGEILFFGEGGPFLIGPEEEHWDRAMLVRQTSIEKFIGFASHQDYLKGLGHRTAALEDSRLLPLSAIEMNGQRARQPLSIAVTFILPSDWYLARLPNKSFVSRRWSRCSSN